MSNLAWSDLSKGCTVLKLHDMCQNPKCNCQKQITFAPKHFNWKVVRLEVNSRKFLRGDKWLGIII